MQLAAEQGVPEAQFQYALMLLDGRFVKKDAQGAYALMQAAAEAGNRLAQFNFAQIWSSANPATRAWQRRFPIIERAAEAGLADAQYAMSQIYANGAGGKKQDDGRGAALAAARRAAEFRHRAARSRHLAGRGPRRRRATRRPVSAG